MLSPADMLIIGTAALLFFGPDQLPKVARRAGQIVRDVQSTSQAFIQEMERAADEPSGARDSYGWTREPGSRSSVPAPSQESFETQAWSAAQRDEPPPGPFAFVASAPPDGPATPAPGDVQSSDADARRASASPHDSVEKRPD